MVLKYQLDIKQQGQVGSIRYICPVRRYIGRVLLINIFTQVTMSHPTDERKDFKYYDVHCNS